MLHSMWDLALPPGTESTPLKWKPEVLTTGPSGKPLECSFSYTVSSETCYEAYIEHREDIKALVTYLEIKAEKENSLTSFLFSHF